MYHLVVIDVHRICIGVVVFRRCSCRLRYLIGVVVPRRCTYMYLVDMAVPRWCTVAVPGTVGVEHLVGVDVSPRCTLDVR
jgi:hypothetical protein